MVTFFQNINVGSEKHLALNGVLIVQKKEKIEKRDKEDIFAVLLTNLSNVFWLSFTWYAHCWITCFWFWYGFTKN